MDEVEETLEDKIYEAQYEMIKKAYGQTVAVKANYGWSVVEHEDRIEICTKIYGHGTLTSVGTYATGEITHDY